MRSGGELVDLFTGLLPFWATAAVKDPDSCLVIVSVVQCSHAGWVGWGGGLGRTLHWVPSSWLGGCCPASCCCRCRALLP